MCVCVYMYIVVLEEMNVKNVYANANIRIQTTAQTHHETLMILKFFPLLVHRILTWFIESQQQGDGLTMGGKSHGSCRNSWKLLDLKTDIKHDAEGRCKQRAGQMLKKYWKCNGTLFESLKWRDTKSDNQQTKKNKRRQTSINSLVKVNKSEARVKKKKEKKDRDTKYKGQNKKLQIKSGSKYFKHIQIQQCKKAPKSYTGQTLGNCCWCKFQQAGRSVYTVSDSEVTGIRGRLGI